METKEPLSIDNYFEELDNELNQTKASRELLIEKLLSVVGTTEINPTQDAPRVTEVKLACIREAASLLVEKERRAEKLTKLNLAKKINEDDAETSSNISNFLRSITKDVVPGNSSTSKDVNVEEAIAQAHRKSGMTISNGETRTDSEDYS